MKRHRHNKSPLSESDVEEIRRRFALYLANSPKRIAEDFNKSVNRVYAMVKTRPEKKV